MPTNAPNLGIGPAAPPVLGYQVLGELGRGGMGVVYKARHRRLNRLVALKMVLSGGRASPADLERFQAEAEAVAQLHHRNIVQIYEIGEQDGQPFFALEFVDGGSLDRKTANKPQLPRTAASIVRQLAEAMQVAHDQGIIHRDLKPANVLLSGAPDWPLERCVPKITDFGLARKFDGDSTRTRDGSVMGTPSYMSPEQAQGKVRELGPATDIYALGAVLYDLLTGRPPFRGVTAVDTIRMVVR
jgi:serine/threonine-protein kinase